MKRFIIAKKNKLLDIYKDGLKISINKFHNILKAINKGEFNKAIEKLDFLNETENISEEEVFYLRFLKSTAYIELGDFKKGIIEAKELFNQSRLYEKRFFEIDALLNMYDGYCRLGSKEEAIRLVTNIEDLIERLTKENAEKSIERRARFYRLQGDLHFFNSEYDDSLAFYKKSLADSERINNNILIAWALNNIGNIFYYKRNLEKAKEYYERSYEIRVKENILKDIIKSIGNLGILYFVSGDLDKSLELYSQGISLIENQSNIETRARFLGYIGMVYQQKGNLSEARDYYLESLSIHNELGNLKEKAFTLTNLGQISYLNGNLDEALEYYVSSIDIKSNLDDKKELAISYDMMGSLFLVKGELEDAIEYFEIALIIKEKIGFTLGLIDSYTYFGEISMEEGDNFTAEEFLNKALNQIDSNSLAKASVIYLLIKLHLQNKNLAIVDEFLEDLEEINKENKNNIIKFQYSLSKTCLMAMKNDSEIDNGLKTLRTMIYDDCVNDHKLQIDAMKALAKLLYEKLRISENIIILDELRSVIQQLRDVAEKKHLYTLIVETRILNAKMMLLDDESDIEKAENELNQIFEITISKKLNRLKRVIKKEIKNLQNTKSKWVEIKNTDSKVSLTSKLDLVDIDQNLNRITVNTSKILY